VHTRKKIVDDLMMLGLSKGDAVVVHSSYKKIGEVEGRARGFIDALLDVVTDAGALLFPNLNIPGEFTKENPPRFDLRGDDVRKFVGVVPQVFKQECAEHFSLHPTHSMMGRGKKAPAILLDHDKAGVPCGVDTPWHKNALHGGYVLLVGVDQKCNTTHHCAEEQIEDSYQLSKDAMDGVVIIDGKEITVSSRLHVWGNHPDFNKINGELQQQGFLREGTVGDARAYLLDALGFLDACRLWLERNPRHFLTA
jgi:aminoglycoside 3-N-acetyltransferase